MAAAEPLEEPGARQRGVLNRLFQLNRRVFKAYMLKESPERLWDYRYGGAMAKYLGRWMDQLRWQRLPSFQKLAAMLIKHLDGKLLSNQGPLWSRRGGQWEHSHAEASQSEFVGTSALRTAPGESTKRTSALLDAGGGCQALSTDGAVASGRAATAGDPCGRASCLSTSNPGVEGKWRAKSSLPVPTIGVFEQCAGARSPIP